MHATPSASQAATEQGWFTMRRLWLWLVPGGLFVRLCLSNIPPNDFWWHVRTGQLILQSRAIPTLDLFTYTQPGAPWINQAWLMQVLLALLMQWGGAPLVIFVHALLITTGYTLVLRACAPRYGVRISVWSTVIGIAIGIQTWVVRPQTFSFLAFGLLLFLIEKHRQGHRRALWWAAPLFVVWVNAHGVFVFGLAALGLYVVGTLFDAVATRAAWAQWSQRRGAMLELCSQGLLALAALMLNPQGPIGIINYVLGFFQSTATVEYNQEFAPLVIRTADGLGFAFALLILIVARLNSTARLTTAQTLTLLAFAAMTLFSRRSAAWFGMAIIPMLATLLQGWWRQPWPLQGGKPALTGALMGVLLVFAVLMLPWWRPQFPALAEERPWFAPTTPIAATPVLCATFPPGTRGYQAIAFASYMEAVCPDLPTFMDTRFELFPTEQWDEYIDIHSGRYNWDDLATKYGMVYIFADVEGQPNLVKAATAHPNWQEIYRDERAVIFQKEE